MEIKKKNIYHQPDNSNDQEIFEIIHQFKDCKIERIFTVNPYTKAGQWCDQELDEWVLLLKGTAIIEIKNEGSITLIEGDYIFLPAHKMHRIKETSRNPSCIWLAVHGK